MHVYGGLPAPLAVAALLALAGGLSIYYALAAGVVWRVGRGSAGWRFPLAFAAAWTLAELARGQWFTGFPWGAGGYAHVQGPLAALAPWVGVYGVGFAATLLAVGAVIAIVLGARKPTTRRAWPVHARVANVVLAWYRAQTGAGGQRSA